MVDIEVLKIALSKEEEAIETYQRMLSDHPNLKDLPSFLVTEDQKHKIMIEKKVKE